MAGLCGARPNPRAPRRLRRAVRHLGSPREPDRRRAERDLAADWKRAEPLLRMEARAHADAGRAVRAALLLHRHSDREGADLIRRMVRDPRLRAGPGGELLRRAARSVVGAGHWAEKAGAALTRLEQRPESARAVERFQAALDCAAFLGEALPPELLARALVVRTVGGEDMGLVRAVLLGDHDATLEHACLARKQAAEIALALPDRDAAFRLLSGALAHPSPAVQLTALYGLGPLGDGRALPAVGRLARDPDGPLYADARRCLALLTSVRDGAGLLLRPAAPDLPAPDTLLRPARDAEDPATLLRVAAGNDRV